MKILNTKLRIFFAFKYEYVQSTPANAISGITLSRQNEAIQASICLLLRKMWWIFLAIVSSLRRPNQNQLEKSSQSIFTVAHVPFSLELEGVQSLRGLLPEGPQVDLVIRGGGNQGALVDQEPGVKYCLAALVANVGVYAGPP